MSEDDNTETYDIDLEKVQKLELKNLELRTTNLRNEQKQVMEAYQDKFSEINEKRVDILKTIIDENDIDADVEDCQLDKNDDGEYVVIVEKE